MRSEGEEGVCVTGAAGQFGDAFIEGDELAVVAVGEEEKLEVGDLVGAEDAGLQRRFNLIQVDIGRPVFVIGMIRIVLQVPKGYLHRLASASKDSRRGTKKTALGKCAGCPQAVVRLPEPIVYPWMGRMPRQG